MDLIEAIILGIIQGATEFLPISSSGHLLLLPDLLNMAAPTLSLIAIVHLGTLLAVLLYFWKDLLQITREFVVGLRQRQPFGSEHARTGWFILVGSIPAAAAGLTLNSFFEEIFGAPRNAAFFLLITATMLVAGERLLTGNKAIGKMNWGDAIIIGLFQMFALLPGISRSGSTITAGLWRGLDRAAAARYSFLLGVPAILGAGLLSARDLLAAQNLAAQLPMLVASFLAAAITGYACIHLLLSWLRRRSLTIFAAYCAFFGLLYLLISLAR